MREAADRCPRHLKLEAFRRPATSTGEAGLSSMFILWMSLCSGSVAESRSWTSANTCSRASRLFALPRVSKIELASKSPKAPSNPSCRADSIVVRQSELQSQWPAPRTIARTRPGGAMRKAQAMNVYRCGHGRGSLARCQQKEKDTYLLDRVLHNLVRFSTV